MLRSLGRMSLPSDELVATLNAVGLLLTIVGVLLLFQRHRYDWRGWLGLVFIVVGTVCQIMANRV